jgi:glyoxylase-like metal-dependent hydrolase (beta-lactamase superfamily II)
MTKTPIFKPRAIFDDLLVVPMVDDLAERNGYSTNGYILFQGDRALLIDLVSDYHFPIVAKLREGGKRPVAVVLTHRHLLNEDSAPQLFERELGVRLFLHPLDAADQGGAGAGGLRYEDPTASALLSDFGVEASLFAGHTPGHVLLVWSAHGGVVFSGDCAVGSTAEDLRASITTLRRPPPDLNDDDDLLRRNWGRWDRRVATFLPLHGEGIVGDVDAVAANVAVLGRDEPTPAFVK